MRLRSSHSVIVVAAAIMLSMFNTGAVSAATSIKSATEMQNCFSPDNTNKNNILSLDEIKPIAKTELKNTKDLASPKKGDDKILLYILSFLIPFLAVGLATNWKVKKVLICLLLSILFWIPGVIYALIVVSRRR